MWAGICIEDLALTHQVDSVGVEERTGVSVYGYSFFVFRGAPCMGEWVDWHRGESVYGKPLFGSPGGQCMSV